MLVTLTLNNTVVTFSKPKLGIPFKTGVRTRLELLEMSQNSEGFLIKLHDAIDGALDDVARNNFSNLESNSKRVAYLCNLPAIKNYELGADVKCHEFPRKDVEKARRLKEGGNRAVQKEDWGKALKMYSDSMIFMPIQESE